MSEVRTNVIEKGQWERELEVEVPAERIDSEVATAFRRYRKRLEIPGFRKGKVPMKVIESRYGPSIRHEVVSRMLPDLVQEAAQSADIVPASTPTITLSDHEPGKPLTFKATMDIWPKIDVENYERLAVSRMTHEVSDEEVDRELEKLRERNATEMSVERPLEKGDVLVADLQGLNENGVALIGDRYEERYFLIGSDDAPSPEFEEALIGIGPGEERRVDFSYREDLPNKELAGQKRSFNVTVREIRERTLPVLDDEFAKDLGDQFDGLEGLREYLRRQLQETWDSLARRKERSDLVDGLIRGNPFDLPDRLVESYIERVKEERDADGDGDEDPPGITGEERISVIRSLKTSLLLDGLRKKLNPEVTEEETTEFFERRAQQLGFQAADLKRSPRADDIRRELENEKIFEYLGERAEISEESV
ncbi:MAG: trigger factor [Gemmatimonadetes bacterium]|nr:trigger factor [Gemmatimonadota bacterium]